MAAKPSTKVSEELSPLELLRRENELLRETISSADSAIEELEAQLQVFTHAVISHVARKQTDHTHPLWCKSPLGP